ncbi:MAG TPA: DUF4494 domain-containing protein [Ignavibacteriaceae bacterium]
MKHWFLVKVKYAKENEDGLLKSISEEYLADAFSFTECEAIIYDRLGSQIRGDFQITHIAKSNIVDVFFYEDSDIWFKCKISYLISDGDSGKEKKIIQYMIVTAKDVTEAHERIRESLSNMLVSFEVPSVVETKILEVYPDLQDEEL